MEDSKELFLQRILEHLTGAMKNFLHPSLYEHSLREIGVRLGQEVVRSVQSSDATTQPFRQEDYLRCLKWMNRHWGWDHEVTEAQKGRIGISIPHCRFGKCAADNPHICQIEAGILGGIAGNHFGYAKVEIFRGSGVPPKACSLHVHHERTPQSIILEGPSFPLDDPKVTQSHRVSPEAKMMAQLSRREQQIVRLIGEGLSDKIIAHTLGLSVRTVEGHVARIRNKTGLMTRSALIRLALLSNDCMKGGSL
jgi:DNA-binding CsgD family transcriptional regulator